MTKKFMTIKFFLKSVSELEILWPKSRSRKFYGPGVGEKFTDSKALYGTHGTYGNYPFSLLPLPFRRPAGDLPMSNAR